MNDLISCVIGWLQALATPAIAAAGVAIAFQQKKLADTRLRNDVFDRRFKIYESAVGLLRFASGNCKVPVDRLIAYREGTATAAFFFGQSIQNYLEEIRTRANEMNVQSAIVDEAGPNQNEANRKVREAQQWFADQILQQTIIAKFKPEMALDA